MAVPPVSYITPRNHTGAASNLLATKCPIARSSQFRTLSTCSKKLWGMVATKSIRYSLCKKQAFVNTTEYIPVHHVCKYRPVLGGHKPQIRGKVKPICGITTRDRQQQQQQQPNENFGGKLLLRAATFRFSRSDFSPKLFVWLALTTVCVVGQHRRSRACGEGGY